MSTFFQNGIEFVLPEISKAYPLDWADQFLLDGTVYFTNSEIFRKDEDEKRGDPLDCVGVTMSNGMRCTSDYTNPIFVFCCTMETNPTTILTTWRDRDTVLQFTNTLTFAERVRDAAIRRGDLCLPPQVGPVTYNKDEGSHRDYHWAEGIFQKSLRYNSQKEFRFALIGNTCLQDEEHIILTLGQCQDIARRAQ